MSGSARGPLSSAATMCEIVPIQPFVGDTRRLLHSGMAQIPAEAMINWRTVDGFGSNRFTAIPGEYLRVASAGSFTAAIGR